MRLLFAGDFCPINRIADAVESQQPETIFTDLLPVLREADLAVTNLECPLTERKAPINKVGPHLSGPPRAAHLLKQAGFQVVSLANNHITDHGPDGLSDTCAVLAEHGLSWFGAGENRAAAERLHIIKVGDQRVGLLGVTENEFTCADETRAGAAPLDPLANCKTIAAARPRVDLLIVMPHGGNEQNPFASPRMVQTYRAFIDAGADAVIGSHPHVPQGVEWYRGGPIVYSLGNFIFDKVGDPPVQLWRHGYLATLEIENGRIKRTLLTPHRQRGSDGYVERSRADQLAWIRQYLRIVSASVHEPRLRQRMFDAWCVMKGANMIEGLHCNDIAPERRILRWCNRLRCEAHHELLSRYAVLWQEKRLQAFDEEQDWIHCLQDIRQLDDRLTGLSDAEGWPQELLFEDR